VGTEPLRRNEKTTIRIGHELPVNPEMLIETDNVAFGDAV